MFALRCGILTVNWRIETSIVWKQTLISHLSLSKGHQRTLKEVSYNQNFEVKND